MFRYMKMLLEYVNLASDIPMLSADIIVKIADSMRHYNRMVCRKF